MISYSELRSEIAALVDEDWLPSLCNAAAALKMHLPDVNWVGFYLRRGDELVVGPFQGLPACIRIPIGKGVCGTAAQQRKTQVVDDVHAFAGHIACDSASQSEIVIPMIVNDQVVGVLDVDSARLSRFTNEDRIGLEAIVQVLMEKISWGKVPKVPGSFFQ